jgi:hypothetical protein
VHEEMLNIPGHKGNTNQRFRFITGRITIIKNKKKRTNKWQGFEGKETLIHCWWECKLVQPLWKPVWRLLKKLKIELPYDPEIPLLGIYPKECKSGYNKNTCILMFIAALFTIAKIWKQPRCPLPLNGLRKCGIYIK